MTVFNPLVDPRTADRVRQRIETGGRNRGEALFRWLLISTLGFALLVLAVLLIDVITDAWPVLTGRPIDFLSSNTRTRAIETGIFQGLRGTFWIGIFVTVLTFPTGIAAAIYLEEYASDNWFTRTVNVNIRNLAGVPSVVYGILGLTLFVGLSRGVVGDVAYSQGNTTAAGGLTLAILSLPVVIITSAEAIRAVPSSLKEAAYGVGATKSEVIRSHVLPYAAPGIFTGTLLSLARALGEAAPLILVGAVQGKLGPKTGFLDPAQLGEKFTAMPILITHFANQPGSEWQPIAAAAIIVLLAVVLSFNALAVILRNRFEAKREG